MSKILLVDDDVSALDSMRRILELAQYEVITASDGQIALEKVRAAVTPFDLILTDVRMPRLGGLEFLRALSVCGETTPVVLMTAFGRVEDAVWAMKLGAVDFLSKPFKRQTLLSSIESVLKRAKPIRAAAAFGKNILGESQSLRDLRKTLDQVAPTVASVLLTGESGTGKELVARRIHELSPRASAPFIAINCAALPETLMEAELFGYEKGAFTGATGTKAGLFEAAFGGTLLLDEIGDMPLSLQAKLLRVLQENEVRRIGATQSIKTNVRLIAATHRNLKQLTQGGQFRQDLLYRLEVIGIELSPLRDRMEDLPDLTHHFLNTACERHQKSVHGISEDAMAVLLSHSWPGNVRELSNVIERAIVFAQTNRVELQDLPSHLIERSAGAIRRTVPRAVSIPFGTPLKDVEELLIRKTLEATDGDKKMTAKLLGINSRTIYRKLDKKSPEEI